MTCNAFGFGASVYRTRRLGSSQPCEWLERLCVSTGTQGETGFPRRGGCRPSVPATGVTRLTTQGGAAGTHGPSEQEPPAGSLGMGLQRSGAEEAYF